MADQAGQAAAGRLAPTLQPRQLAWPWFALVVIAAGAWAVTVALARSSGNGPGTMGLALRGTERLLAASPTAAKWLGVAIFIAAGSYQLTGWKDWCLRHCRSPLGALMHYAGFTGRGRDARVGLHHG